MLDGITMMAPNGSTLTVHSMQPNENGKFECLSAAGNGKIGAKLLELSENELTSKIENEGMKFVPPGVSPTIKYDELDAAAEKWYGKQIIGENLDISG